MGSDKQCVYEVQFMLHEKRSRRCRERGGLRCIVVLQVQIQPATFQVIILLSPSTGCCLIKQKCAEKMRRH